MTPLGTDRVRHLAGLVHLDLTDAEVAQMQAELTAILGYVAQLGDVADAPPEPAGRNRFRPPGARVELSDAARTANAAEHEGGAFRVPKVIG